MIHTFELKIQIPHEEYEDFIKGKSNYKDHNSWVSADLTLEEFGLKLYARKTRVPGRPDYYAYELIVNPCKLLGRNDITNIYQVNQYADVVKEFNQRVKEFNRNILPQLNAWSLNRVDYTRNIKTEHVELYVKLLQKADLKGYSFKTYTNPTGNRFRKGSLYCQRKPRSYKMNHGINFYDKYDEVCKRNYYTEEEREQARDVLRIEVQCARIKMNTIRQKFHLPTNCAEEILRNKNIADYVINYYVRKILRPEPYYKREIAERIIEQSNLRRTTKDKMIFYIREISKQYSAVDKVRNRLPVKEQTMCREQFQKLGINMVTIMDKEKNVHRCIPSILQLLELETE